MNERIRELVRQAVIAVDDPFPGNPLNDELEKMYIPDCFAEKFAELIVRECVNEIHVADVGDLKGKSYYLDKVAEHIEKHFGVRE